MQLFSRLKHIRYAQVISFQLSLMTDASISKFITVKRSMTVCRG